MAPNPSGQPTDAEMAILHVLWEQGPSTVREVHERLSATRELAPTTVLTQLQVMHKKGLVVRDESVTPQVYRPAKLQHQVERSLINLHAYVGKR